MLYVIFRVSYLCHVKQGGGSDSAMHILTCLPNAFQVIQKCRDLMVNHSTCIILKVI